MLSKENNLQNVEIKNNHLNHFNYDEFKGNYLLTNDYNQYVFLSPENFKKLLQDELNKSSDLYNELWRKGFIKRDLSEHEELDEEYRKQKSSLFAGPSLHIIVVTLRCNYNCIYCQASAKSMKEKGLDMDKETARKTVDTIFETPSDFITIEFQGGEPLANWEIVKFIVNYARKKEEETEKTLQFSLVTNLSLMTEEKLDFLTEKLVGICTSLDGPKEVHNKNRPYPNGDSYEKTVEWIEKYRNKQGELSEENKEITKINSLVTLSKISLDYPEEIVDEYIKLGFHGVHLRPLSYLGYSSGEFKDKMGYSVDEFLDFWKEALDYIVDINNTGSYFIERGARIKLRKIIARRDPGFTDLSSPCGAAIGQMLYNYDGDVYTCDEGRMIEDDTFKIGEIGKDNYEDMISSDTTQAVVTASLLDNQPCDNCVYKPYCGVCPVKNYSNYGTIFPQMPNTGWCKLQKGQFNYLFEKLRDEKYKKVFEDWVEPFKN
ncbi:MAG: His-Xaa-Ser system radical SAM maturase HxsB [Candidatus Woesearchaeota archaeon]